MIRKATVLDLPAVKEIYNYAVLNTTATYDINLKDDKYFVDMLNEHTGKYLLSVYEGKRQCNRLCCTFPLQ